MHALFATFDVFPLPKGASTHIAHTIGGLGKIFDRVSLASLGNPDMPRYQEEGGVTIYRCLSNHPNFLHRTGYFHGFIDETLAKAGPIDCVHFRDIWSGIPLFENPRLAGAGKVFEVNGLPSVELPYHYPAIRDNEGLLARVRGMEDFCLRHADRIVTVSGVTKRYLEKRGVDPAAVHVLPNTCDHRSEGSPGRTLFPDNARVVLYAGTLASWQGIDTLLDAFALLGGNGDAVLCMACSTGKHVRALKKNIRKKGLGERARVLVGVSRETLAALYREASLCVAPLAACARNVVQGCSPLKIIEPMFAGTPVVASRIPVCREIIDHGVDGWLVPPDSPRALAAALAALLDDVPLRDSMGAAAREKMERHFSMDVWLEKFENAYSFMGGPGSRPAALRGTGTGGGRYGECIEEN